MNYCYLLEVQGLLLGKPILSLPHMNFPDANGNVRIDNAHTTSDALPSVEVDLSEGALRLLIFTCLSRGNKHATLLGPQSVSAQMVEGVRRRVQERTTNPIDRTITAQELVDEAVRQYKAALFDDRANLL